MQLSRRAPALLIALIFACMFAVGLFLYRDYGVSVDEPIQRQHSLVAYRYILEKVFHRDVAALSGLPELQQYQHRFYGVFLQLPMVFWEHLHGFTGDLGDVMRFRHLATFTYCFIGYLCFYWMSKRIFQKRWIAMLGTLMLYLYPRYFATQFFYIKDTLFAATVMITMWAAVLFLEKGERPLYGALFCFAAAVCANARFMGMMFPALLIGFLLLRDVFAARVYRNGVKALLKRVFVYASLAIGFLIVYVAISPVCWETPVKSFFETIKSFAYYDLWQGSSLFMGHEVQWNAVPWYFIPVWMLISLPLWYSLLFVAGLIGSVLLLVFPRRAAARMALIPDGDPKQSYPEILLRAPFRYVLFALALFFLPLLMVIVRHSVLYNDWRQMYFLLVPFVVVAQTAIYAFFRLVRPRWIRRAAAAALAGALLFQAGWIASNHPFEHQFLNCAAAPYRQKFSRDVTRTSLYSALKYLVDHAEEDVIVIDSAYQNFIHVSFQIPLLTPAEQARIRTEEGGTYQFEQFRYADGNDASHDGYEPWYTISIGGYAIAGIFKAIPADGD